MKLIYAREQVESSIFLAGPTPRDPNTPSWRPKAIEILEGLGYKGTVYIPEDRGVSDYKFDEQIKWEWEALNASKVIAFWVPRELSTMPAFTTNIEFGMYASSGKCLLGTPVNAPKNNYLRALATRYNLLSTSQLEILMAMAIMKANE